MDVLRAVRNLMFERSPTARMVLLSMEPRARRSADFVRGGYDRTWSMFSDKLAEARTLEEWLRIPGLDDGTSTYVKDGRVRRSTGFDMNAYWVDEISSALTEHFPGARSVTEYGCGVGRKILAIKARRPELVCRGYELSEAGVGVANDAAQKFGIDVSYASLDYVRDPPERYVHGQADVALTVFSLEQIPYASGVAVKNMLDHSALGSIHVEPVSENYPKTYLGMLGRLYSRQVDYLKYFDRVARSLPLKSVELKLLPHSHNPLIPRPSLYVLSK
jgi:hypothetical protein